MLCIVCQDREAERPRVCTPCCTRVAAHLREVVELHAELTAPVDLVPDNRGPHWRNEPVQEWDGERWRQVRKPGPVPGTTRVVTRRVMAAPNADPAAALLPAGPLTAASRNGRVSGGAVEAAAPVNLDAVDLALPAALSDVHDPYGDQTGHPPTAAVLLTWCRDWATIRAQREHARNLTVPTLASWLYDRLDWACAQHPAVDDFAAEMRQLRGTLCGVLGLVDVPKYYEGLPCEHCEALTLYRANGEDTTCGTCGSISTDDELAEWSRKLTSKEADL